MKLHVCVYVLIILAYAANDVRLPNVLGEDEIMLTRCVGWVRGQLCLAVRNAALMACGPACILLLRFIFGRSWAVGSVYLLTFCSASDGTDRDASVEWARRRYASRCQTCGHRCMMLMPVFSGVEREYIRAWRLEAVQALRQLNRTLPNQHLVWVWSWSCPWGMLLWSCL